MNYLTHEHLQCVQHDKKTMYHEQQFYMAKSNQIFAR